MLPPVNHRRSNDGLALELQNSPPETTAIEPTLARRLALPALLAAGIAIGCSPVFVRLSELPPTATAFYRVFLSLPALLLWTWAERHGTPIEAPSQEKPASRRRLAALMALAGIAFAGDLIFWHWSIRFTTVANATLLANLAPIPVAIGAYLCFGQPLTRLFLLSFGIAILGAVTLVGAGISVTREALLGDAMGVVTACFYAVYFLSVGAARRHLPPAVILLGSTTVCAIVILPVALLHQESMLPASGAGWGILVALALVSQVGGQGLIAFALAHLPAALSSLTLLIQPLAAALFAWVLFGERLTPRGMLGGVIIIAAILLARSSGRVRA